MPSGVDARCNPPTAHRRGNGRQRVLLAHLFGDRMKTFNRRSRAKATEPWDMRVGAHTGAFSGGLDMAPGLGHAPTIG